ncbi:hypothetical protein P3588_23865 [Vibrio parahaemolyticus]|nr:hypothetical protein [Vibrio parahaemolyticus]
MKRVFLFLATNLAVVLVLSAEESPNDFDKNHQVKVDTHLVV